MVAQNSATFRIFLEHRRKPETNFGATVQTFWRVAIPFIKKICWRKFV